MMTTSTHISQRGAKTPSRRRPPTRLSPRRLEATASPRPESLFPPPKDPRPKQTRRVLRRALVAPQPYAAHASSSPTWPLHGCHSALWSALEGGLRSETAPNLRPQVILPGSIRNRDEACDARMYDSGCGVDWHVIRECARTCIHLGGAFGGTECTLSAQADPCAVSPATVLEPRTFTPPRFENFPGGRFAFSNRSAFILCPRSKP